MYMLWEIFIYIRKNCLVLYVSRWFYMSEKLYLIYILLWHTGWREPKNFKNRKRKSCWKNTNSSSKRS